MTVRRLCLLRHAKSDWADARLADHDRPLAPRGRRALPLVASYLNEQDFAVDLVLSSTAKRALDTVAGVVERLDHKPRVQTDSFLYLASPGDVLACARGVPESVLTLLLCGHNPGLHEFAQLAGVSGAFPTAALAVFRVESEWSALEPVTCALESFVTPRALSDGSSGPA
jgi:phosphohistidine phosphatase